jgi:hypothetical protein
VAAARASQPKPKRRSRTPRIAISVRPSCARNQAQALPRAQRLGFLWVSSESTCRSVATGAGTIATLGVDRRLGNWPVSDNGQKTAFPSISGVRCQYKFRLWAGSPLQDH